MDSSEQLTIQSIQHMAKAGEINNSNIWPIMRFLGEYDINDETIVQILQDISENNQVSLAIRTAVKETLNTSEQINGVIREEQAANNDMERENTNVTVADALSKVLPTQYAAMNIVEESVDTQPQKDEVAIAPVIITERVLSPSKSEIDNNQIVDETKSEAEQDGFDVNISNNNVVSDDPYFTGVTTASNDARLGHISTVKASSNDVAAKILDFIYYSNGRVIVRETDLGRELSFSDGSSQIYHNAEEFDREVIPRLAEKLSTTHNVTRDEINNKITIGFWNNGAPSLLVTGEPKSMSVLNTIESLEHGTSEEKSDSKENEKESGRAKILTFPGYNSGDNKEAARVALLPLAMFFMIFILGFIILYFSFGV